MSDFNPLPESLNQWRGMCPSMKLNGNCCNKICQFTHPKIKKVTKKKLQFKKKEFKPTNIIKKTSLKERMKKKSKLNKKKGFHFQPSSNINNFKKKKAPEKNETGVKRVEMKKKLNELKKCQCCKGNYNDCNNSAMCMGLGQCYCKMHLDMENQYEDDDQDNFQLGNIISDFYGDWGSSGNVNPFQEMDDFIPEYINCICCNGYVNSCNGPNCFNGCFCVNM